MSHAWDRQDGETAKAYKAFTLYRDMAPSERSLEAAYHLYQNSTKTVPGYFKQWSADNDWVRRAEAYDTHRELERREELGTKELEDFRQRQRKLAAASVEAAVLLLTKATKRLQTLQEKEISPGTLPSYFRAAASIADAATNAEATAAGVTQLLKLLADGERLQ